MTYKIYVLVITWQLSKDNYATTEQALGFDLDNDTITPNYDIYKDIRAKLINNGYTSPTMINSQLFFHSIGDINAVNNFKSG